VPAVRVLMVSWEYPPIMYGGLGRHVHALSEALAAEGHDVTVLAQGPEAEETVAAQGAGRLRVVRAPMGADVPDVYADTTGFVRALQPRLAAAAAGVLESWLPDVVHGHDWVVADAATTIADTWDVPLVATVHATEAGLYQGHLDTPFSQWRHGVERALVARATRTIVCSTAMADEVVTALGAERGDVVVVPNGVDVARWSTSAAQRTAVRQQLGVEDEPLLVLVGRLEHEKGAQDAIDALALLSATHPHVHLVLVGDGARAGDLRRQARDAGVDSRVHLVGRVPDDRVAATVAAADVALVPSRYEPFGIVALEAMAAGTPVVVTSTGGLADIVDDRRTGRVVAPAAPAALAAAVDELLSNPDERHRLSTAASHRLTDHFGWGPVAAATAAVYSDAVA
jgi:glycogen(starch) synthase